jgi:hypothetical protein
MKNLTQSFIVMALACVTVCCYSCRKDELAKKKANASEKTEAGDGNDYVSVSK